MSERTTMEPIRHLVEWTLTGRGEIPLQPEIDVDADEMRKLVWFGARMLVDSHEAPPSEEAFTWKEIG